MKKSFTKIVSVLLAVMLAVSAMAVFAAAETEVVKNNSCLNTEDTAGDTITKFQGNRDIYLVLDVSGSMSGTPIKKLKEAAKTFCKMMLEDTTGDNRIAIVTYGTTVASYDFSTDYEELSEIIDSFTAKGSTAMYDALMKVKEMNEKYGRKDASRHVVVMADGLPNEGATLTSGKYTSKDSSMYYKYGNAVYSTAAGMWYDYNIYSIGFFHNLGGSQLRYGKQLMKDIQNALYLEVFDPDKLLDAFTGVADEIIGNTCNCDEKCACGENCNCGDNCKCAEKCTDNDEKKCNCGENCPCGENCTCGDDCKCAEITTAATTEATTEPTTAVPSDTETTTEKKAIEPYGDSSVAIAAAAVVMIAGIAVIATKKRED